MEECDDDDGDDVDNVSRCALLLLLLVWNASVSCFAPFVPWPYSFNYTRTHTIAHTHTHKRRHSSHDKEVSICKIVHIWFWIYECRTEFMWMISLSVWFIHYYCIRMIHLLLFAVWWWWFTLIVIVAAWCNCTCLLLLWWTAVYQNDEHTLHSVHSLCWQMHLSL